MVPLKNIWTVVKKIGRLFPTVGDFAAWWLQNMLSLSYSFWLVLALLSSLSDEGRWWHVNCCSRGHVSQMELHAWLIVQHTLYLHLPCAHSAHVTLGRLPFPSATLP